MVSSSRRIESLLGPSQAMRQVRHFARRAARVDAPVLILGETGTGKSLLGRLIHGESSRAVGPFLPVNCAGIPESLLESEFFGHQRGAFTGARDARRGLLEQAQGGTLFLDEVGELGPGQQAKLLTAVEEGEVRPLGGTRTVRVDVRILAATSVDLSMALERGRFRRDLFHRLAVLTCRMPPLRSRPEDIPVLARRFLLRHGTRHGIQVGELSRTVLAYLQDQPWPGNVRQLSHLLEAGLILSDGRGLTVEDLKAADAEASRATEASRPPGPLFHPEGAGGERRSRGPSSSFPSPRPRYAFQGTEEEELEAIRKALAEARGNKSRAARELGMARNTLRRKLRRYGLS